MPSSTPQDIAALKLRLLDALDGPGSAASLSREDVMALLNTVGDMQTQADYWRAGCIYLADIHAANGSDCDRKSVSKSARNRLRSIMSAALDILEGRNVPQFSVQRESSRLGWVADRLGKTLEETADKPEEAAPSPGMR